MSAPFYTHMTTRCGVQLTLPGPADQLKFDNVRHLQTCNAKEGS